jgi:DNA-binding MarR family transcriptional regulator
MSDENDSTDAANVCQTRGDQDMVQLAKASGLSDQAAQAVASIDAIMARLRRNILRRDFGRRLLAEVDPSLDIAHFDVIGAISHNPNWGSTNGEEVTVGLIAERLAIDPSRASRVVAEVVDRGYARRVASQSDARRICLELTRKGDRFVEAVRQSKWDLFARALGQWEERDLVAFAALFERFSSWTSDTSVIAESAEAIKRELRKPDTLPSASVLAETEQ